MPTVMFLGHSAAASGGEIALLRLIPALQPAVHPVVVLGEDGALVERLTALGVDVRVMPLPGSTKDLRKDTLRNPLVALGRITSVLRYAVQLRRVIRELDVDLVHTNSLKAGFYGTLAARLAGVPSVWHVRDRIAPDYLPGAAVAATRLATAVLPSRVISNSRATAGTLSPRLAALLGRRAALSPAPIGDPIDTALVQRASPRTGDGPLRIGMVGRFSPWKGQLVAIRAFAQAHLGDDARLVLIGAAMFGEQDYERQVHEEIDRLGLRDRVELTGFVTDVFGVLSGLDVLVHASTIPEPFGQVVLEGLAAGVPVVATREGGPGEILTDHVDGLLHDAGDVDQLAAALRELQADPALRARLTQAGLARVLDFSPQSIGAQVLAVYAELISTTREVQTA
ncbi:glycosyltransferase family 4 protein [Modestobacter versicolor]|uniref:Glycosyltransferase family 1 protein n=1 Tax=Modestobacter versicolor TaxID=429133 RepID=A0A323VDL5_9ACTN|nr:glycosyltransferase family 4 protein [Modestobacter versicolor]MBB3676993.1 glycosyltransferase involved in cell wall biosynthesis [Modestobacter versicolor]PZA22962.1 glycosyltransferase family 1 protein [Modestobacter versicolor]